MGLVTNRGKHRLFGSLLYKLLRMKTPRYLRNFFIAKQRVLSGRAVDPDAPLVPGYRTDSLKCSLYISPHTLLQQKRNSFNFTSSNCHSRLAYNFPVSLLLCIQVIQTVEFVATHSGDFKNLFQNQISLNKALN